MSVPSSLKVGPFTSNILLKRRYLFFYFFIVWGTLFFIQFELWLYWKLLYHNFRIQFYIFLPLLLFVIYISAVFVSLIIAKILLIWVVPQLAFLITCVIAVCWEILEYNISNVNIIHQENYL